jgi:hypothetical protein
MIGEWMKTLKDVSIGENDFDYSGLEHGYKEDVPDALHNIVFKTDDYGIDTNLTYFNFDEASSSVIHALTGSEYRQIRDATEGADQIADTLVMATVEKDRSMINYFFEEIEISRRKGESSEYAFKSVNPKARDFDTNDLILFIENSFEELDEEVFESATQADFSSGISREEAEELEPEELERRKEEVFDELERDIRKQYVNYYIKYALPDALHDTLSWYLKKKPLPALPLHWEVRGGRPKYTYYQVDSGEPKKERPVLST